MPRPRKARHVPQAPRARMRRHPQTWEWGSARICKASGSGLDTHQLGLRFHAGPHNARAPCSARRGRTFSGEIAAAPKDVPVNADFEGGFADESEGVAESVKLCVEPGVAGALERGLDGQT